MPSNGQETGKHLARYLEGRWQAGKLPSLPPLSMRMWGTTGMFVQGMCGDWRVEITGLGKRLTIPAMQDILDLLPIMEASFQLYWYVCRWCSPLACPSSLWNPLQEERGSLCLLWCVDCVRHNSATFLVSSSYIFTKFLSNVCTHSCTYKINIQSETSSSFG